ncbi:DUF885 domain-containing protein [Kibdelosporangium phytohabitans]|uniref:DUF885 domain-containing protein n=1 Tax=Kibdelosporangium phytohabitans TaxID=860235 RepID=UPI001A016090|nr:uncharacterized protein (DUF885 family) [Kibdelosporangium phytohabitans]
MINELADELLAVVAEEDPLNDFLDRTDTGAVLPDPAEEAQFALARRAQAIAERARALEPGVTRGVLLQQADALVTRVESRLVEHTMWDFVVSPIAKVFAGSVAGDPDRLAALPRYLAASARRHVDGAASGRLPVGRRAKAAVGRIDAFLAEPSELRTDDPAVLRAFADYRDVLAGLPGRPDERSGLCWLPDGDAIYARLARMHTTTAHTPRQLHQTGLDAMARLDREFEEIGKAPAARIRERIRADPSMRYRSEDEVLAIPRAAIARAWEIAPKYFSLLPDAPCAVEPTPAERAPGQSVAAYSPARAVYYANTYRWQERDRCIAEANAFHEGVPGHHFQISVAKGLTGVPRLRKVAWINAYLEGWSLYCERLADELGLYSGDEARIGMLVLESVRAARLVVDTGLHAFGWPRQRVVDYLREHTAMNEVEVQQETDRYIELPGQGLSYLCGRLEFDRIRAAAAADPAFELRAFHDLVLGTGPVPMDVLADVVTGEL